MRGRFFVTVSALLPIGTDTRQKNRLFSRPSRAILRKIGTNSSGHVPPDAVSPTQFSSRIIARLLRLDRLLRPAAESTPDTRPAPAASTTPVDRPLASRLIQGSVIFSRPIASIARLFRYVSARVNCSRTGWFGAIVSSSSRVNGRLSSVN